MRKYRKNKLVKRLYALTTVWLIFLSMFNFAMAADSSQEATIRIVADDGYELYVNGALIHSERGSLPSEVDAGHYRVADLWQVPIPDTGNFLIAVKGEDTRKYITGLAIDVLLPGASQSFSIVDSNWKLNTSEVSGWNTDLNLDTSSWSGVTPIGLEQQDPNWSKEIANWGWTPNYRDSSENPMDSVVYFRYSVVTELPPEPDMYPVVFDVLPASVGLGSVSPSATDLTYPMNASINAIATPASSNQYFVKWWGEFFVPNEREETFDRVLKPITDITVANASFLVDGSIVATDATTQLMNVEVPTRIYAEFANQSVEPVNPDPPIVTTTYTLTVNVVGPGTVPGFQGTNSFSAGTNVNLSALADNADVTFVGWSGDLVSTNLADVVLMNSNKTVTATFEIEEDEIIEEVPEEEIPEEVIPEEIIPEEVIPEVVPEVEEILDEEVSQELTVTELPETSGIPLEVFGAVGMLISGFGLGMFRKEEE